MKSFPLPSKPEEFMPSLVERFNSGSITAQMELYSPEAVFVLNDGQVIPNDIQLVERLERDLKLGIPLIADVRHIFVSNDIAQIVVDWSIKGAGPDGKNINLSGSACDIIRRGSDGYWRYIIDNNRGTDVRE